ncbi:TPA: DUF3313 domain-containing protein [Klebsiella quasipneumoniae subsp. similipneumoniae]|nr:DUF3313 domain-containing protein [Klebsiella quasipneumoniae subsp. similipneumoniae]
MKPSISVLIFAVSIIAMTACSTTSQPGRHTSLGQENLNGSGFLNDVYPLMKDGKDGEALRLYRNPKYISPESFTRFTKVQLDPVKLYVGPRSKLKDIPQDQAQGIAQSFYNQLYEQFGKDYQMAQTSGPDTLRISIAIVDAEASNTLLKAASYVPLGFPGAKAVAIQATTQMTGQPLSTG